MNRRNFLTTVGATTVITGCTRNEDSSTPQDTEPSEPSSGPSDNSTNQDNNTSENQETGFELVEISAPEEVKLEKWWRWSVTIRNHEQETEVFNSDVSVYHGNGEWETINEIDFTIPGDDERTFESPESQITDPAVARYRIEAFDEEFEVRPSIEELSFGDQSRTLNDLLLTLDDVDLFNSITNENGDEIEAEDGEQFGKFQVELQNDSEETKQGIDLRHLFIWAVQDQNGSAIRRDVYPSPEWATALENHYQNREFEPGDTITGNLAFEIPEPITIENLTISYTIEGYGARWGDSPPHNVFYDNPSRKVTP